MDAPGVIFEDADLLIINKPSGWVVNQATTVKGQPVIQTWLQTGDYPLARNWEKRSGIVHRLDKETSGVLVVAKTELTFKAIQAQFKQREVQKAYTALVHGQMELKRGEVDVPIGRLPWNAQRFGVFPGGRPAQTSYRVEALFQKGRESFSLVTAFPKTGRTHQVRVHFQYLGHPIVADEFYAGRKTSQKDRQWCPRLFLHASKISFIRPRTKKKVSFKADLPQDLVKALSHLQRRRVFT